MKQLEHDNILPFYGVSMTISDLSLVFPWYKNGNIKHYLSNNPGVDRYDVLLGAVEGLLFLHSNGVVQGALRPSHILIDDGGNARLAIATHDRPTKYWVIGAPRRADYMAPETLAALTTGMECDVYGMAIVAYEILTGISPHCTLIGDGYLGYLEVEGTPARPHDMLDDLVWGLLEKCWSWTPEERPSIVQVYHTLKSRPKVIHTPRSQSVIKALPGTLMLHVHSIRFSGGQPSQQQFYVKLYHGERDYTTSPTNLKNDWGAHTWNSPENWVIKTDEQHAELSVNVELFRRTGPLKRVYATGYFFPTGRANEHIVVGLGELDDERAAVKILITTIAA